MSGWLVACAVVLVGAVALGALMDIVVLPVVDHLRARRADRRQAAAVMRRWRERGQQP